MRFVPAGGARSGGSGLLVLEKSRASGDPAALWGVGSPGDECGAGGEKQPPKNHPGLPPSMALAAFTFRASGCGSPSPVPARTSDALVHGQPHMHPHSSSSTAETRSQLCFSPNQDLLSLKCLPPLSSCPCASHTPVLTHTGLTGAALTRNATRAGTWHLHTWRNQQSKGTY